MMIHHCPRCGHALRDDDGESWPFCENCGWSDNEDDEGCPDANSLKEVRLAVYVSASAA
jgi:predicted  nucleic acid-binding Zn-ribbon protein